MTETSIFEKANKAASYIKEKGVQKVEVGLILGSGLGELADEIEDAIVIPYEEIPNFPYRLLKGMQGNLFMVF